MKYDKNDPFYYYEIVRLNIKKYRVKANLTQHELAELTGISQKYLSQIESDIKDKKYFTLTVIGKIANALNIDIAELFKANK